MSLAVFTGDARPLFEPVPLICIVSPLDALTAQDEANAYLIAASPTLLRAAYAAKAVFNAQGLTADDRIVGQQIALLDLAIEAATKYVSITK